MTREPSASARFHVEIDRLAEECRPTRHPSFFARLAVMPQERLTSAVLSELHLRSHKLQIYIDDDGLVGGDTHHHQLSRAFTGIGAPLRLEDEQFGELDELVHAVEERHGREAVEITSLVLDRRPELLGHTVEDARTMARALYRLWGTLDEILDPPGMDVTR
jgi:hypothetical protein